MRLTTLRPSLHAQGESKAPLLTRHKAGEQLAPDALLLSQMRRRMRLMT